MFKMNTQQLVAVLLSLLLAHPGPLAAAEPATVSRTVLGSITARGSVLVGETPMPGAGTIFSGDQVQTRTGSALIQYQQGARVLLASNTLANFSDGRVQLQEGSMSFRTAAAGGPAFAASTLRLEPAAEQSEASVTLNGKSASVMVTAGTVNVLDPSGVQLASLRSGEARLFEEAAAGLPPAAAPAAPPQGGSSSGGSRTWLIGLGAGLAGAAIGIAGFVRANDSDDRADEAEARLTAAEGQVSEIQSQNAALQAEAAALQAQIASLQASAAEQSSLLAQVNSKQAEVNAIQAQLIGLFNQVAAQGGVATPAQIQQLQSLSSQLQQVANEINQLLGIEPPVISPTRNP